MCELCNNQIDVRYIRVCKQCIDLSNLRNFSNLESLCVSKNDHIVKLPDPEDVPNLTILSVSDTKITEIPFYPKLQKLYCCYNEFIDSIPAQYTKLVNLSIKGQKKILTLHDIPTLEDLAICRSGITELIPCDGLKRLEACHSALTKIPEYKSIEVIDCWKSAVVEIPTLYSLKKLYCDINKVVVPNIPGLTVIDYSTYDGTGIYRYKVFRDNQWVQIKDKRNQFYKVKHLT
jgi:Leucine-rich repeat (LRR) protein